MSAARESMICQRRSEMREAAVTGDIEALKVFLTGTPFFGGLSDVELDRVARMCQWRELPAGASVFCQGDTGRSMYIIEHGEIIMTHKGLAGLEVKLVRLNRGDFFGETTLIEMQPRPCTARCTAPVRLLELSNMDLYRLYREDVKAYVMVLQNINRELCRRLRRADGRIAELAAGEEEVTQIRTHPILPDDA
jgi:CRP/FNR family cyclic AMP-dependent transcriptional regulator